jgi:hypothetical protein
MSAARGFHVEKWPTTGGWRYTSRGLGPAERADGQTHNENEECPAEPDMKTSLRNGNGQSAGSAPIRPFRVVARRVGLSSESAPLRTGPAFGRSRQTFVGTRFLPRRSHRCRRCHPALLAFE